MIDVAIIVLPETDRAMLERCLYSLRNERVPVYFIEGVKGCIGHGRAESIKVGTNPYVSFVDPDDEIIPGIYAKLMGEAIVRGNPAIIYHNEIVVDSTNNTIHHGWSYDKTTLGAVPERFHPILWDAQNERYFHHRGIFRRSDTLPFLDKLSTLHEACEPQLMQMMSATGKVQYLNEWGYIWNIHGKNTVMEWL